MFYDASLQAKEKYFLVTLVLYLPSIVYDSIIPLSMSLRVLIASPILIKRVLLRMLSGVTALFISLISSSDNVSSKLCCSVVNMALFPNSTVSTIKRLSRLRSTFAEIFLGIILFSHRVNNGLPSL